MEHPIACNLNAFTPEQRIQHEALAYQVFGTIEEVRELADGYAFRLSHTLWREIAEFISLERLCCPFFHFRLELQPDDEVWLSLTGLEGVKELVYSEFNLQDRSI